MDSGNSKKPTMASIKTRPLERNIALTKLGLGAGTKIVAHSLFNIFRGEVAPPTAISTRARRRCWPTSWAGSKAA